ncbi:nitroreductase [Streptacidiphilus sp. MAP12-16]|uniref:Acg family FMN-binding oxidoreductase n=1 Tax=Streptacidiphilus sp. MAP12-16 TaxID=3156300 RepID=UPI00351920C8
MQADLEQSVDRPGAARAVSRRKALQILGLGSGLVAVSGASGLTWRAVEGGVFSTGTGSAYDAWGRSKPGGHTLNLVNAAILAANAHNTQPWLFTVSDDRIELFSDMSRTIGAMDPLLREMQISLGCAVENLALAAAPNGMTAKVSLLPVPYDATHIATVSLAPAPASGSALFDAIAARHTNRGGYDTTRPVTGRQLDALSALVDAPATQLVWFTTNTQKRAFSDLTVRATQAIIADPQQAADDYRWYRSDWHDIQLHKDGITIDPSGQSALIRALSKLLPTTRKQDDDGWLSGTRDTQLPTAAAFGALVVRDPHDPLQRLQVGRIWQRMHLAATTEGLGMQPLCQIPERVDRETSAGLAPDVTEAVAAMLPADSHAIMTFRIGYPTAAALLSPRRPAGDVVRA